MTIQMTTNRRVSEITSLTAAAALTLAAALFYFYPPSFDTDYIVAYVTLMGLGIAATLLHLRFSSAGYTSSMDFVPELGAVLLVGPAGALIVTIGSEIVSGFLLERRKPLYKKIFNASQLVLAVGLAALAFMQLGGMASLDSLSLQSSLAPFIVAVLVYFAVNTGVVSYIVAAYEQEPFLATWRQLTGGLILFDITMSFLAFTLAWFYVQVENPVFIFAAIIPLIGLRYSYGTNYELQRLNQDLLRLMVKTIEAQDPYTSGHSLRVAAMAKEIGQTIGLRGRQLRNVENAALLHDLGKIDVAYSEILRQTGALTAEQRQLIREHPERGVDIVRSVRSIPDEVLSYIKHHHERWDGKGYPDELAGVEIPLGARIIMVCDTIDAMATARPYRDPLPVSVVREELLKNIGSQFDERIVKTVLSIGILDQMETRPVAVPRQASS